MAEIEHPTPATLRQLSTLNELPQEQLQSLADQLTVHSAAKGTQLLARGSSDPTVLYLLNGQVKLHAADGATKLISHQDSSARAPLARLRPSRYEVTAASKVDFLRIDSALLDDLDSSIDNSSSLMIDTYQVDEDTTLSDMAAENQLTVQIYEDLNSNQLLLPSLPDIAIRVGQAVNHDFADASRVARVVENDPTMAAKLLKVANSARYSGSQQIGRLSEAITRIGLDNTHQLVITFALRELFRSSSRTLNQRMRELWENTRQVAAIAHVLSEHCPGLDPQSALLGGLLHDIGSVAILSYARDFPEVTEDPDGLEGSLTRLRAQLGSMIIAKWHLPSIFSDIAANNGNWQYSHEGPCNYADLMIVAQLHALIGKKEPGQLPSIDQVPAYKKLGFSSGATDSTLNILESAQQEIRQSLALLGS